MVGRIQLHGLCVSYVEAVRPLIVRHSDNETSDVYVFLVDLIMFYFKCFIEVCGYCSQKSLF